MQLEVLPEGITADDVDATPVQDWGERAWTQSATVPTGPGWSLFVDQAREGHLPPQDVVSDTVIQTTQIHGRQATIYQYLGFTDLAITWIENGLEFNFRAELATVNMNGPATWDNPEISFIYDELLRIAEGSVVPPS